MRFFPADVTCFCRTNATQAAHHYKAILTDAEAGGSTITRGEAIDPMQIVTMTNKIRATQGVKALADQQRQRRKAEPPSVIRLQVICITRFEILHIGGSMKSLGIQIANKSAGQIAERSTSKHSGAEDLSVRFRLRQA